MTYGYKIALIVTYARPAKKRQTKGITVAIAFERNEVPGLMALERKETHQDFLAEGYEVKSYQWGTA